MSTVIKMKHKIIFTLVIYTMLFSLLLLRGAGAFAQTFGGSYDGNSMLANAGCTYTVSNVYKGGYYDGYNMLANTGCTYTVSNVYMGGSCSGEYASVQTCPTETWTYPACATRPALALPIELLSFEAFLQKDNTVLCKWTTETEINNDYFTVEKSPSAFGISPKGREGWGFVAKVDGAGNSSVPLNYSAIDPHPEQGISYYRLKQTDFNGDYTYSDLRAINLQGMDIINISPNPVEEEITIMLYSSEKTKVNVNLYNVLGQKTSIAHDLLIGDGTNYLITDVSAFSTGYYIAEIITVSGLYRVQKQLIKK